ncbi:hypothetical protein LEP1GSC050_0448 [Leptospira broomii serovar Hurstbridge str. 5399]|uniref:Uncharacterized protein n=1 Tax=Leptospira broomii serovar Hurstbridge str. 5399 TaxID=1049789 RepID=T0FEW4_9LEPT|nr:hypothetical protein LEP1GSC050_0448 [Leptospira broomii serovar Hurstbridge str. 5399]
MNPEFAYIYNYANITPIYLKMLDSTEKLGPDQKFLILY